MKALAVGGMDDHAHLLLSIPPTIPVSKAMQLIKGGSSAWIKHAAPALRDFAWQEAYGAFSIGISQAPETIAYIERQAEHHRMSSFQDEYVAFLRRHGIVYHERYVWG